MSKNPAAETTSQSSGLTREIAEWIAAFSGPTPVVRLWARHALLDWAAVTVAGSREPLAAMLCDEFASPTGPCTVVATGRRAILHDAALINGATSHALDFDDVNFLMHGHPTVPVAPVVLALGEVLGASGRAAIDAFVAGYEVESRIGEMAGHGHYDKGFHATGTMGTFGAAAAAARLMRLNANQTAHALGIAASQAAGLKSMFGTMTKPFHAGKAAMNGLIAARLAGRGFTASTSGIEAPQGFADTQAPEFQAGAFRPDPTAPFAIESNLFKYHAACYLTHSTIEAVAALRDQHVIGVRDLASMTIFSDGAANQVCNIGEPDSGLQVKFSIRHLAALALDGADTADLGLYDQQTATLPHIVAARERIAFQPRDLPTRSAAAIALETRDGRTLVADADVGVPASDLEAQWIKLVAKTHSIATPVVGNDRVAAIIGAVTGLDDAKDTADLMRALA